MSCCCHHHCGPVDYTAQLTRMENMMATISEQLDAANAAVASLGDQLTDTQGDLEALLAIVQEERGKFTPDNQSKMDALMANIADRRTQADATDAAVGEHDGLPVAE